MITEQCNLRCPSCLFILKNPDQFYNAYISVDKFREILEKYNKQRKFEIIFLSGGEALMHPNFKDIVDTCLAYQAKVRLSSSGILVPKKISSLLEVDYINVSIDSYDYASFKKYRGGSAKQFDLIKEGLKLLKDEGLYFSISFVLAVDRLAEADKMIEFAEEIRPPLVHFHNINSHGCKEYKPLTVRNEETQVFLKSMFKRTDYPFNIQLPYIFDPDSSSFQTAKCRQLWNSLMVNTKGDVSFCCHLSHSAEIGNVFNGYAFNSEAMIKFRHNFMQEKMIDVCRFCQRRFPEEKYGAKFDSTDRKWLGADETLQENMSYASGFGAL